MFKNILLSAIFIIPAVAFSYIHDTDTEDQTVLSFLFEDQSQQEDSLACLIEDGVEELSFNIFEEEQTVLVNIIDDEDDQELYSCDFEDEEETPILASSISNRIRAIKKLHT